MADKKASVLQKIFQTVVEREGLCNITPDYRKQNVLRHICGCRSSQSNIVITMCPECGHNEYHYGSCHDSCCPICGEAKREAWIATESQYILDVPYYHIVFTVPHELNPLFLLAPKIMYNFLFKASSEALKEMGKDSKWLGAEQMGFMMMLHSFGSNLSLHPHVHCLAAGCGLDGKGDLVFAKKKGYFMPVKALAKKFKGIFLNLLKNEFPKELLDDPNQLESIRKACNFKKWNVELRDRTNNKEAVMNYLGRYVNRTAISESRIKDYNLETGQVTFSYKDYADHSKVKDMVLSDSEFVRRFLMHVPPKGFMKLRFYGFWGNRDRVKRFAELDKKFEAIARSQGRKFERRIRVKKVSISDALRFLAEKRGEVFQDIHLCPQCKTELYYMRA